MSHLKFSEAKHLLRSTAGHLVLDCESAADPCAPDCAELATAYTIADVELLVGCASCLTSAAAAWDGVIEQVGDTCQWNLNSLVSIAGRLPSYALGVGGGCPEDESINGVGIWFNTDDCRWELAITCRTSTTYPVIWAGVKTVGASPAGEYTRVCGCDETETLMVS